jgi:DNA repair photolyase
MLSGVTDCYQPVERELRITRSCLEVALEARQPVSLITKNALIVRDLDLLSELAGQGLCRVAISLSTMDQELTKVLEPACSAPAARLEAVRKLSTAGIPVHLMAAPLIPGLTDSDFPEVLQRAAAAGAKSAGYIMVRLPLTVEPVFLEWLQRHRPDEEQKVRSRLQSIRGGRLSQSEFHVRMRGTGIFSEQISALFRVNRVRSGLSEAACRRCGAANAVLKRGLLNWSGIFWQEWCKIGKNCRRRRDASGSGGSAAVMTGTQHGCVWNDVLPCICGQSAAVSGGRVRREVRDGELCGHSGEC